MLVLSRERNERIYVGNDIIITIADVHGDKVRIGIDAPAEINIVREELIADPGKTPPEKSTHSQQLIKSKRIAKAEKGRRIIGWSIPSQRQRRSF